MKIAPILTAHPATGAVRHITADLLGAVATTARMMARLQAIAATLPDLEARRDFRSRVALIGAGQNDEAPDWTSALRKAAARPNASSGSDRFVEGVSLFTESALPWRPVRQLIMLGMAGRAWPRPAPANPLFTDSEMAQIKQHTDLTMRTRADVLNRRLELFRRQLCAASDGASLLVPARDAAGKPLAPAIALALIGRALRAAKPEFGDRPARHDPRGLAGCASVDRTAAGWRRA